MADTSPGEQLNTDPSISTFTSALWFNAALAGGFFGAFAILRQLRPSVYSPRSYLVDEKRRPPELSKGLVVWIFELLRIPDSELLRCMGLDRFMILKFLRMGIVLFTLFSIIAIPILIPVNVINQRNSEGLNLLTMGNIKDPERLWAHLVLSVLLSAGFVYYSFREVRQYIRLRRQYLLSPEYAGSVTARTLFVPAVPESVNSVEQLAKIFNRFPGGVARIWLTRNAKDLPDLVQKRQKSVQGLESAITSAIIASYKHYAKKGGQVEGGSDASHIPEKLRPTHRVSPLPFGIPFVGRKVDSITYYQNEIKELNEKIIAAQQSPESFPRHSSAFIEFNQQIAAHMAVQCIIHSRELQMAPRYIQIAPSDVIWENMNIKPYERFVRRGISLSITAIIIMFWAIPVAFVQGVSNIDSLSKVLPFLAALKELPSTAVGIIQGILPAVALAILVSLVPIIFNLLSTNEGIPAKSKVSLAVLEKYFYFLFVDVVLVSTIAGGAAQAYAAIAQNPLSVINTLAESLPKASTFFITYVTLQSLSSTSKAMCQLVPLLLSYVFPIFAKTPRDIYNQKSKCPNIDIGTLMPSLTVIFVLGIEYSTIAPLILPFTCLFFYLMYFVYLYQFLYVYEMEFESGGLAFPISIRHVYIGLFTWQLTLIGLFAVHKALPQLIIMAITLVVSAFALALFDISFKPLVKYLPVQENEEMLKAKQSSSVAKDSSAAAGNHHNQPSMPDDDKKVLTEPDEEDSGQVNNDSTVYRRESGIIDRPLEQEEVSSNNSDLLDAFVVHRRLGLRLRDKIEHAAGGSSSAAATELDPASIAIARQIFDSEAYMHPSFYRAQPTVWLPQDDLGITQAEMEHLKEMHILTSSEGACVEHRGKRGQKGKVKVDEERIVRSDLGIPNEMPEYGRRLPRINDYVRVLVDSYNIVSSMAITAFS